MSLEAVERLLARANEYRGLRAHHSEQGHEELAQRIELVELCLREIARALDPDDEDDPE